MLKGRNPSEQTGKKGLHSEQAFVGNSRGHSEVKFPENNLPLPVMPDELHVLRTWDSPGSRTSVVPGDERFGKMETGVGIRPP